MPFASQLHREPLMQSSQARTARLMCSPSAQPHTSPMRVTPCPVWQAHSATFRAPPSSAVAENSGHRSHAMLPAAGTHASAGACEHDERVYLG